MKKRTTHILIVLLVIGVFGSFCMNLFLIGQLRSIQKEMIRIQDDGVNALEKAQETKDRLQDVIEQMR